MAGDKYGRKGKKRYATVIQLHDKVQEGDLCWTRDLEGNYYLGVVESDWFYDASEASRQYDMVNLRRCRWSPKMSVDQVPGKVVNSFVGRRPTLQSIKEPSAVAYSFALANQATVLGTDYPVSLTSARLLDLISFDDCEDLVGIYLQSKGYFLVPSSCKKSTVGYEYLLQHRETGKTAVAQVKKGKVDLNQTHFEPARLAVDRVFLFTTEGQYLGEPHAGVVCLSPDTLIEFAQAHPDWMPYRIRFWMDRLSQPSEAGSPQPSALEVETAS
ncbi:hypothetical protein [Vreelandella rituensis]|nr:hypothetical protein [Halomonas rituensis]